MTMIINHSKSIVIIIIIDDDAAAVVEVAAVNKLKILNYIFVLNIRTLTFYLKIYAFHPSVVIFR